MVLIPNATYSLICLTTSAFFGQAWFARPVHLTGIAVSTFFAVMFVLGAYRFFQARRAPEPGREVRLRLIERHNGDSQ